MGRDMRDSYQTIKALLDANGITYEVMEHEPIFTSEQAARVRSESIDAGAKSLLLKADDDFLLAVLPGGRRLSFKKLKNILGLKNLRFASPQEVKEIMGCEVGSCYPFGKIIGIKTVVDHTLSENEEINFSPALHDKTIKLKSSDYLSIADAQMVDICEPS